MRVLRADTRGVSMTAVHGSEKTKWWMTNKPRIAVVTLSKSAFYCVRHEIFILRKRLNVPTGKFD